ncbi:hypothetical protein EVA_07764 [gut metagenome]|uniref:Uncharacterized protein n=1 Tax=gut metagenome TaxID=749906 RepID=J9GA28_9ZZZZ
MTSFVASHFVNCIVDSIEVQSLSTLSDTSLVFASTAFSVHTLFEVSLSIPYYVAQEFSELSSVFCFFPSVTLESFSDFRITFTICLTAHCQVHTYFCALAEEMVVQVLDHLFVATLSYAYFVFRNERQTFFCHFLELRCRNTTHWALFRSLVTFVNITANCANKLLLHNCILLNCYVMSCIYLFYYAGIAQEP